MIVGIPSLFGKSMGSGFIKLKRERRTNRGVDCYSWVRNSMLARSLAQQSRAELTKALLARMRPPSSPPVALYTQYGLLGTP